MRFLSLCRRARFWYPVRQIKGKRRLCLFSPFVTDKHRLWMKPHLFSLFKFLISLTPGWFELSNVVACLIDLCVKPVS